MRESPTWIAIRRLLLVLYCGLFAGLAVWTYRGHGFFAVMAFAPMHGVILVTPMVLFAAIATVYALLLAGQKRGRPVAAGWVLGLAFVVAGAAAAVATPSSSCDLYYYTSAGWMQGKLGLNPYFVTPRQAESLGSWVSMTLLPAPSHTDTQFPYQFGFALLTKWSYFASGGHEEIMYLLLKGACVAALGLTVLLLSRLARALGLDPDKRLPLVLALSPVLLIEFGVNGHNDILAILPVAAALWALSLSRPMTAIFFFIASLAFKPVIAFAAPFVLVYLLRNRTPLRVYVLGALALAASLAPYPILYDLWGLPAGLKSYAGVVFNSLSYAMAELAKLAYSFEASPAPLVARVMDCFWFLTYGWLLFRYAKRPDGGRLEALCPALEIVFLVYFAFFARVVWPWYVPWIMLFACLSPGGTTRLILYSIAAFAMEFLLAFLDLSSRDTCFLSLGLCVALAGVTPAMAWARRQRPRAPSAQMAEEPTPELP